MSDDNSILRPGSPEELIAITARGAIASLQEQLAAERARRIKAEELLARADRDTMHTEECPSISQGPYVDVIHSGKPCSCGVDDFMDSLAQYPRVEKGE